MKLDFIFHSSDHLRYENGIHTSGPHGGAPRAIKVEANISGNEGYTVTMFNTDGGQANVQMAPKQMRLVGIDNEKIELKGYGNDNFGTSFSDYGLTIYHNEKNIEKCILHMYDRNVDIEYLKVQIKPIVRKGIIKTYSVKEFKSMCQAEEISIMKTTKSTTRKFWFTCGAKSGAVSKRITSIEDFTNPVISEVVLKNGEHAFILDNAKKTENSQ